MTKNGQRKQVDWPIQGAYCAFTKAMPLLRIRKGNNSNNFGS